ncbi:hypothetical protein HDU84_001010 [Entophlyctis sp. JEL0112]|nr:hypothetical protein HDU84_001010 [Entophlyctis sp. JEL0112]
MDDFTLFRFPWSSILSPHGISVTVMLLDELLLTSAQPAGALLPPPLQNFEHERQARNHDADCFELWVFDIRESPDSFSELNFGQSEGLVLSGEGSFLLESLQIPFQSAEQPQVTESRIFIDSVLNHLELYPIISAVPTISLIGSSSLLFQFKFDRHRFRALNIHDLTFPRGAFTAILAPFGIHATVLRTAHSKRSAADWASAFGLPTAFFEAHELLNDSQSVYSLAVEVMHPECPEQVIELAFPAALIVLPLVEETHLYNYDDFRDILWNDAFTSSGTKSSTATSNPSNVSVSSDSTNSVHRLFEMTLMDGGTCEHAIRSKETPETLNPDVVPKLEQVERKQKKTVAKQPASNIIPTVPNPTLAPPANESKKPVDVSPLLRNSDDLAFNLGSKGSTDLAGLELDDIGDNDWDFFAAKPPPSQTTAVTAASAASPALSVPACSPAAATIVAFTPGGAVMSPAPFTPGYSVYATNNVSIHVPQPQPQYQVGHSRDFRQSESLPSGFTGVQPTPDPTTPGCGVLSMGLGLGAVGGGGAEDAFMDDAASSSTLAVANEETGNNGSSADAFDVQALLSRRRPLDNAGGESDVLRLLPDNWRGFSLAFRPVWNSTNESGHTGSSKYGAAGAGAKYEYPCTSILRKKQGRPLAGDDSSPQPAKRSRVLASDTVLRNGPGTSLTPSSAHSTDSEESSPVEDEEEILEDGEVMMLGSTAQAISRPNCLLPKNDIEAELALRLMVWDSTICRRSVWGGNGRHLSLNEDILPVVEHRLFNVVASVLEELFARSKTGDPGILRGPLTLEQISDYNEVDRGTDRNAPKYGRFQLKKKRRPESALEMLQIPKILVSHNGVALTMDPSAIKFWDKLSLAPVDYAHSRIRGTRKLEYVALLFPRSTEIAVGLKRWMAEFTILWDYMNFGTFSPLHLRSTDQEAGISFVELSTDQSDSTSEMYIIASRLLQAVCHISKLPLKTVCSYVVPLVLPLNFCIPRLGDSRVWFRMREFAFGLYARCKSLHSETLGLFSLPYTLAKPPIPAVGASGLMMHRPMNFPICSLSDPDRIMHISYSLASNMKWMGICWCDSAGEFVDSRVVRIDLEKDHCAELEDFDTFVDYLGSQDHPLAAEFIYSASFVTLNTRAAFSILDLGAVKGQPGCGASQSLSAFNVENVENGSTVPGEVRGTDEDRILEDGPASFNFIPKLYRTPVPVSAKILMSLLRHINFVQAKGSCYAGWNAPSARVLSSKSDNDGFSSPSSSSSTSTPAAFVGAPSATNTPVLVPAGAKMSPTMTQFLQHQTQASSSPLPSMPFGGPGFVASTSGPFLAAVAAVGGPPQPVYATILRDIMREYHALRHLRLGAGGLEGMSCVTDESGAPSKRLPWMFQMAKISAEHGIDFV